MHKVEEILSLGIPIVTGDMIKEETEHSCVTYTVDVEYVDYLNNTNKATTYWLLEFVQRQCTGVQPVPDDVLVVVTGNNGVAREYLAKDVDWVRHYDPDKHGGRFAWSTWAPALRQPKLTELSKTVFQERDLLLLQLGEECSELSQQISKCLRFGLEDIQPGKTLSNRERLFEEYNDLLAIAEMLHDYDVTFSYDHTKVTAKREKVEKYLEFSRELGLVQPKKD
jgi:hypothetical protein